MKKKQVTIYLNEKEMRFVDEIKEHFSRNSYADTLRYLILEAKKNLSSAMSK
jgi:hypothetical protein